MGVGLKVWTASRLDATHELLLSTLPRRLLAGTQSRKGSGPSLAPCASVKLFLVCSLDSSKGLLLHDSSRGHGMSHVKMKLQMPQRFLLTQSV